MIRLYKDMERIRRRLDAFTTTANQLALYDEGIVYKGYEKVIDPKKRIRKVQKILKLHDRKTMYRQVSQFASIFVPFAENAMQYNMQHMTDMDYIIGRIQALVPAA